MKKIKILSLTENNFLYENVGKNSHFLSLNFFMFHAAADNKFNQCTYIKFL